MDETKLAILEKTGTADVRELVGGLRAAEYALTVEHDRAERYEKALRKIRSECKNIGEARGVAVMTLRTVT